MQRKRIDSVPGLRFLSGGLGGSVVSPTLVRILDAPLLIELLLMNV